MSVVLIVSFSGDCEQAVKVCAQEVVRLKLVEQIRPLFVAKVDGSAELHETLRIALSFPNRRRADQYSMDLLEIVKQDQNPHQDVSIEFLEAVEIKGTKLLPPLFP